jgi:pSer/pThr/pTyr-binding forkhead associated (FHA) protein
MDARLIPLHGGDPIEIGRDLCLVGRQDDCDIRINHKSISKQHCVIVKTDGALLLRDLGSTNGTRVNHQRVRRAALVPNDIVAFAAFQFRVVYGPADPSAPSSPTQSVDADDLEQLDEASSTQSNKKKPKSKVEIRTHQLPDTYPERDTAPEDSEP